MPKTMNVSEFRKQVLDLLDHLPPEGIVIARRGEPLAKLTPMPKTGAAIIGALKGRVRAKGNLFSTGIRWEAQGDD
jgi:antitoxin (DNA-binding transcriptional repressor) of toxin-antitoxin stability system